tara:strand:- start:478 stop:981 length:504 start_codon:yes stop_codon:yes gene_type:complete
MQKAYEVCTEMLLQRGCQIRDNDDHTSIVAEKNGITIGVFFIDAPKFNVELIEKVLGALSGINAKVGIIVHKGTVTACAKKITNMEDADVKLEIFHVDELQFNVTKHRYVPLHEKVDESEAEVIKKNFGVKFGHIQIMDAISRFYAFSRGDLIRIYRPDGIAYRIVR